MEDRHITNEITRMRIHQLRDSVDGLAAAASTLADHIKSGNMIVNEEVQEIVFSMCDDAEMLRRLVSPLTGSTEPDMSSPCSIKDVIDQAHALFSSSLRRKKLSLNVSIDVEAVVCSFQVSVPNDVAVFALANLIGNAKDAMGNEGLIRVEAQRFGEKVLCRVIDNGLGVPIELRDKLFEKGTTSKENGRGNGLYYTRSSLDKFGSTVELTRTDDTGSEFTIWFPAL